MHMRPSRISSATCGTTPRAAPLAAMHQIPEKQQQHKQQLVAVKQSERLAAPRLDGHFFLCCFRHVKLAMASCYPRGHSSPPALAQSFSARRHREVPIPSRSRRSGQEKRKVRKHKNLLLHYCISNNLKLTLVHGLWPHGKPVAALTLVLG